MAALELGNSPQAADVIGPSTQVRVPFAMTDEQGMETPLDLEESMLIVDLGDEVLSRFREIGEDDPFVMSQHDAFPIGEELSSSNLVGRACLGQGGFYSAQGEAPAKGKAKAKPPQGPPAPGCRAKGAAKRKKLQAIGFEVRIFLPPGPAGCI